LKVKLFSNLLALAIAIGIPALAQEPQQNPSSPGNNPAEQEKNAASATQDNSGISGDQVTKPAGAKGTTLIGCLNGPNPEGKYVLTSMQHRTGVQVLGPDDLKDDSGSKVKLTGSWEASPQPQAQAKIKADDARRFQVTTVEVLSQHCTAPNEKTPVSKEKQRQREEQQQQKNSGSSDQASPK
jgi:hypothetical protein